jgi:hypothetical protein
MIRPFSFCRANVYDSQTDESTDQTEIGSRMYTRDYTEADHIQAFIDAGSLTRCSALIASEAESFLKTNFPLSQFTTTKIIEWTQVPSDELNWAAASDDEAAAWAGTTAAGKCSHALVVFSSRLPCLLGTLDFVIRHLDEILWMAPGQRLVYGVKTKEDQSVEFTRGIIEFDDKGKLLATSSFIG